MGIRPDLRLLKDGFSGAVGRPTPMALRKNHEKRPSGLYGT
jgi:hypothetical protein